MKFIHIILLTFLGVSFASAQERGTLKWVSWQEAMRIHKEQPKKLVIDLYTGWCGWCKKMDANTFTDSTIAGYIGSNYIAVKMDAETRDTLEYRGDRFHYREDYRSNELAAVLLNGKMSYPTLVYMDEQLNIITPVPGYWTPEQLLPILRFFGEDIYKSKTWEQYAEEVRNKK